MLIPSFPWSFYFVPWGVSRQKNRPLVLKMLGDVPVLRVGVDFLTENCYIILKGSVRDIIWQFMPGCHSGRLLIGSVRDIAIRLVDGNHSGGFLFFVQKQDVEREDKEKRQKNRLLFWAYPAKKALHFPFCCVTICSALLRMTILCLY